VPTTPAAAGRLPVVDLDGPPSQGSDSGGWSPDDSLDDLLANCPDLAGDLAWAGEAWLEDPERPDAEPTVREVLKAGFWDRTRETGAGFAAGGVNDTMPPGAVLAGRAEGAWADGLGRLSDDELVGVLRAARRLASWAGALELAAAGDLWRRRTAEEDAGDVGSASHADDEIAAALTLTSRAGGRVLGLALALARLPLTSAALAAGDIDLPRVAVIADEVTGLGDAHAAVVDRAVAGAAPGQTTGQLRAATRRAVLAADPGAAQRRKDEALAEARVERWDEHAGTAALAGRDLPPAEVLAADHHLTALAEELQAAGAAGTLDNLRAHVYLALLSGVPVSSLLGAEHGGQAARGGAGSPGGSALASAPPAGWGGAGRVRGSVHLTLPLATWLGTSGAPGLVAGFGPVDAADARDLARALANHPDTTWCLTLTGPDGRLAAHGCARSGPPPGRRRTRAGPRSNTRDGPGPAPADEPTDRFRDGTAGPPGTPTPCSGDHARAGPRAAPATGVGAGPRTDATGRAWTFTMTVLDGGDCDHAWETPAYQPTDRLRHLVQIRHATCTYPGCRRPARQCDQDHTLAHNDGGPTCLCNLASLCRHHHQVKQAPGWALEQTTPGVLTWTTPAGRRYTTTPTEYPS
jgi:hypothetical protein